MSVLIRQPEDVQQLRAVLGEYRILLSGADTGGRLAVIQLDLPPGAVGAAAHIHHAHDEDFVVTEGELTFELATDGVLESAVVRAGGTVSVPRGAAHGFRNDSDQPARCLFVISPSGYEDYFRAVDALLAEGTAPTVAGLNALSAQFATTAFPE